MSRFLGNNSILYVFYSGNGPKASGGDYCIQDFKCKWTLTSGTPSGCENISGAFASNRTFDITVSGSGNGPKASGGDYCIQSNIVFSDEIPASQDMPTNTTDITYVGDNATYSVPMVTSEDANSPNVTVTAFWAWPNNTETDFKCKWTLTSGTPSGKIFRSRGSNRLKKCS